MTYPNGKQALKDFNLRLNSPSLVGLLGPNGAGKSTLMKLLVAALMPTSGCIAVDGAPLRKSERQLKEKLGYLPQDFGLFDELSVEQFLDYMAALKGLSGSRAAIREVIRAVNLEEKAKAKIRTLSGGQRQRVGIAQAMLGDPPFLILDEPTVGLDPEERIHFRNLFSRTAQERLVLLSTHIIFRRRRGMWASSGSRTHRMLFWNRGYTSRQGSTPAAASAAGRWRTSCRRM